MVKHNPVIFSIPSGIVMDMRLVQSIKAPIRVFRFLGNSTDFNEWEPENAHIISVTLSGIETSSMDEF